MLHPNSNDKLLNTQSIIDAFSVYYSDLYDIKQDPSTFQPSMDGINAFLNQINLSTLTPEQLAFLNNPFKEQEIQSVIKSLPGGKAPGHDGHTSEYYKQFLQLLRVYSPQ